MQNYHHLEFNEEELSQAMREGYSKLIAFVTTPEFRAIHDEMRALPPAQRPSFVAQTFMNEGELNRRGITVPENILIQRSSFGDRRPTLFAVKMFLPERFHTAWENVNITFDNEFDDSSVSRDAEYSWRAPMPVGLQDRFISENIDLNSIEPPLLAPEMIALESERKITPG